MSEQLEYRCQHTGGFPPSQCIRRAKRVVEGRSYCGVHARGILQRRAAQDKQRVRDEQSDEEWMQAHMLRRWIDAQARCQLYFSRLTFRDLLEIRNLVELVRQRVRR